MSFLGWGAFGVPVVSPPALGGSDRDPARSLVDGAGVARGLDEGLNEHRGRVVALGLVPGQAAANDDEDPRRHEGGVTRLRVRQRFRRQASSSPLAWPTLR